jgi:hypothetical protein
LTAGLSWYPAASLGKYRNKTVGRLRRDIPFSTGLCKVTQASARRWPCAERLAPQSDCRTQPAPRRGPRPQRSSSEKCYPPLWKPLRPTARQRGVIVDINVRTPHDRHVAIRCVDQTGVRKRTAR